MIVVGLTGSIGMGKSTVTAMFSEYGFPVYDADKAVHAAYGRGGEAIAPIAERFASVIVDGAVDRVRLSAILRKSPERFAELEAIVHPIVARRRWRFLSNARRRGASVAVLDIPLLFETGADRGVDLVVVVSAPAEVQRERVLRRAGMTPAAFAAILARQVPDSVKRERADIVIDTSGTLARTRAIVHQVARRLERLNEIRRPRRARNRVRRRNDRS